MKTRKLTDIQLKAIKSSQRDLSRVVKRSSVVDIQGIEHIRGSLAECDAVLLLDSYEPAVSATQAGWDGTFVHTDGIRYRVSVKSSWKCISNGTEDYDFLFVADYADGGYYLIPKAIVTSVKKAASTAISYRELLNTFKYEN